MPSNTDIEQVPVRPYPGRILVRPFSRALKLRVSALIKACRAFDLTGAPAIPYIAAWREHADIWYEFVGRRFLDLLGCPAERLAETFRSRVVDQRIYKWVNMDAAIEREVRTQEELQHDRHHLREAGIIQGEVDAVYKVDSPGSGLVWLKDQAVVEAFEADRLCLSIGHLTIVTKEMRSEEERLEKERLQVSLEMAGAVCHELNQPIQGISSYAESLLNKLPPGSPEHGQARGVMDLVGRMGVITRKLMKITRYETKDYLKGVRIIDIDRAAEEPSRAADRVTPSPNPEGHDNKGDNASDDQ
jgi:C4-dicarboxylate-specific signal transduction histidine kinase